MYPCETLQLSLHILQLKIRQNSTISIFFLVPSLFLSLCHSWELFQMQQNDLSTVEKEWVQKTYVSMVSRILSSNQSLVSRKCSQWHLSEINAMLLKKWIHSLVSNQRTGILTTWHVRGLRKGWWRNSTEGFDTCMDHPGKWSSAQWHVKMRRLRWGTSEPLWICFIFLVWLLHFSLPSLQLGGQEDAWSDQGEGAEGAIQCDSGNTMPPYMPLSSSWPNVLWLKPRAYMWETSAGTRVVRKDGFQFASL